MERESAVKMLAAIDTLSRGVNEATVVSHEMGDQAEAKQLRLYVGEVMSGMFDVVMHIVRQYPDLDPDKNEPWNQKRPKQGEQGAG